MTLAPLSSAEVTTASQAHEAFLQGHYSKASMLYEQAIGQEPEDRSNYWYFGLSLLLQGQEEEAQTTWLFVLADSELAEIAIAELIEVLESTAQRFEKTGELSIAWVIRQHIREFCSDDLLNLLKLLDLSIELKHEMTETCEQVIPLLQTAPISIEVKQILLIMRRVLQNVPPSPIVLSFVEACDRWIDDKRDFRWVILTNAIELAYTRSLYRFSIELAKLYLRLYPNDIETLGHLASFYQNCREYDLGIQVANQQYELSSELYQKLRAGHTLLRGLLSAGGYWNEAISTARHQEANLQAFVEQPTQGLESSLVSQLINIAYYLVYLKDQPRSWRSLQNRLLTFIQSEVQENAKLEGRPILPLQRCAPKRLKVGYISHCMATHSVGWLARWLIQHHDRTKFEIYGYFLSPRETDPLQKWYVQAFDCAYKFNLEHSPIDIAEQIQKDEIDILIDLDSITLDLTCRVLALKPAPVQITWLGWDAPGIPAIDYFIADPYVLPDDAQEYYSEKIWRLPETYIAVDGFEVGVPTLRRSDLDIPNDAIVFLSAQRGYKRHLDTTRLQLQIIKQVPNSYFLIKGFSDEKSIQKFFFDIAEEVGVERERLRFLGNVGTSEEHRANLTIADVVLDTFPYNGATTTLETLWMGIPIVTRVGEQFAARNSYTMLKNAGIGEGIAWTDEEYVEWGVKLGTDAALRQKIHWDLMQSRQTAPLWNARAFTREMEAAYLQMWETQMKKAI